MTDFDGDTAMALRMKPATLNAMTHGAYAKAMVLPWESEEEFHALAKGMQDELNPVGLLEQEAFLAIVHLYWLRRRSALAMRREMLKPLRAAGEAETDLREDPLAAAIEAFKVAHHLAISPDPSPYVSAPHKPRAEKKPAGAENSQPAASLKDEFDHEATQRWLKIAEKIDARIDKAFAHLAGIKEFKRQYGSRNTPAVGNTKTLLPNSPGPHRGAPRNISYRSDDVVLRTASGTLALASGAA